MSWVKLDDGFPDHPKVIGLSLRQKWMHIVALCYAARHLTDGLVPIKLVKQFGGASCARALVAAGLWAEETAGGYRINDYLDYNPSRTFVESSREQARERMANVRANKLRSSASPSPPHTVTNQDSSSTPHRSYSKVARARGAEPTYSHPQRWTGRCEKCGCGTGHYDGCGEGA